MNSQTVFPTEPFLTCFTAENLIVDVNVGLMELQIAPSRKCLVADVTYEGFFSAVNTLVPPQITLVGEGLAASATHIWLLVGVSPAMIPQTTFSKEAAPTNVTLELFFVGMDQEVSLKIEFL